VLRPTGGGVVWGVLRKQFSINQYASNYKRAFRLSDDEEMRRSDVTSYRDGVDAVFVPDELVS